MTRLPRYSIVRKARYDDHYWTLEWCTNSFLLALWLKFWYTIYYRYDRVEIRINNNKIHLA